MPRRRTGSHIPENGLNRIRSWAARRHTGIILAVLFGISGVGSFQHGLPDPWRTGFWSVGLIWISASLAWRYMHRAATDPRSRIETLFLLVLGTNFLTQLTGGLASPFLLIYVFLILFAAFVCDIKATHYTVGAILFLEGMNLLIGPPSVEDLGSRALIWALGLLLIPLVVKAYLRAERQEKDELRGEIARFKTSAQAFRPLPGIGRPSEILPLTADERDKRGAPFHIRFDAVVENLFWLLKEALAQAHHCLLFLPDEDKDSFRLHKFVGGDARELHPTYIVKEGKGLIGFSVQEQRPYRVGHVRSDQALLGYCSPAVRVQSIMVNPIILRGRVEGILLVDSLRGEAFSEKDELTFLRVSDQIRETIDNRREHQLAQTRAQELGTLMAISESLGSKLDLNHRLETMADRVKEIIPYDHCFIFLVEPGERHAELKVIRGISDSSALGRSIALHDGLLAIVAKRKVPLIKSDLHQRLRGKGVFPSGSGIRLKPASFLGLPMHVQDRLIGVFVMTSQRPFAFDEEHKEFLNTLCSQAALSIADAKLHDEVNLLATTDGLTGVANHRRFHERLEEEIERQARENGTFSLVMIDVDLFKKINDRFGHPAGDRVLKRVALVLVKTVRKIDIVARYGGEEFAVVLLNIGPNEAYRLSERIRKSVEAMNPVINGEPQKITVSLGIAVYPGDAGDRPTLLEQADQALYAAKHMGRNRTCLFSHIKH